jgi:hypothetical protein
MGLLYLQNALFYADHDAWFDIYGSYCAEIRIDINENADFWQAQKTVDTGINFLDNVLTSVTNTVSDSVDTIYDGYLKSQNQELGLKSYGACIDLLVEYYAMHNS